MKLIDKDKLVAEIRKRLLPTVITQGKNYDEFDKGADSERIRILNIIDSIEVKDEVKEVDLEKEFDKCCENYIFDDECEVYTARHFFELGLKIQKGE